MSGAERAALISLASLRIPHLFRPEKGFGREGVIPTASLDDLS